MAIAENPKRKTSERQADAFISGAGKPTRANKQQIMIRIDPDLLERVDRAAKHLGISRSAFIVSSAAKEVDRLP